MKKAAVFLFLLSLFLLVSCGTKSMQMTLLRPAEVNLKGYSKIAVGDIVNSHGRVNSHSLAVADEITGQLVQSGRFDVVDRQHLRSILKEQTLAASGLLDEGSAPQLGRLLGVSVLIFGRVATDKYTEQVSKDEPYKDKKGRVHQRFRRKGSYDLKVNLKIIDVQTSRIILARTLVAQKSSQTSARDQKAAPIDRQSLFQNCVREIGRKFIRLVAPYKQTVKASFETDDQLPEVDQAVALFESGEWTDGLHLLEKATRKSGLKTKVKAKAYYNLGLAQTYHGNFKQAVMNLKKALELNPDSSRYRNALKNARVEQRKAEKLKEQLN